MGKSNLAVFAFIFALVITGVLVSAAQNKTLVIGEVSDSSGNTLEGVKVTVKCNDETSTYTSDDSGYMILFDSNDCDASDSVTIKAEKTGYQTKEYTTSVNSCLSSTGTLCESETSTDYTVFNIASKSISLPKETSSTTSKSGSSSKRTYTAAVKNQTNTTKTDSAKLSNLTIADVSNKSTPVAAEFNEENNEEGTSSITGAVIGAVKSNVALVALVFIAAVLVAYMFVLKRRRF